MEIISHSTANQKLSLSGPRRARVLFWSWQRWKANKSLSIKVVKKWSQTTIICFWKHPFSSQRKRNKVFSTTLAFSVHTNLFSDENTYIILIVPRWHMRLRPEISIARCPLLPSQVLSLSSLLFSFLPRLSSKFLVDDLSSFFHYPVSALMQFSHGNTYFLIRFGLSSTLSARKHW